MHVSHILSVAMTLLLFTTATGDDDPVKDQPVAEKSITAEKEIVAGKAPGKKEETKRPAKPNKKPNAKPAMKDDPKKVAEEKPKPPAVSVFPDKNLQAAASRLTWTFTSANWPRAKRSLAFRSES